MTAPRIPDLKDLLGSRGGRGHGRVRTRGRGGSMQGSGKEDGVSQDQIVQRTDDDAAAARLSAVNAGYLTDEYAVAFCKGSPDARRFPIINRGTYMRTTAIDKLVQSFLNADSSAPKQIISFGAGTDTRFFRLASARLLNNLVYHEMDFASNTKRKIDMIKSEPVLLKTISKYLDDVDDMSIGNEGSSLRSPLLNIHPLDLRSLTTSMLTTIANLSASVATLILSECCLVYLSPEDNAKILDAFMQYFAPSSPSVGIVIYEPIRPNDAFGRTMISNLAARGIQLQTVQKYENLEAQRARLKAAGFNTLQRAADIDFLYTRWLNSQDKSFVASREMMDEVEEWTLLAQHYCVIWGAKDASDEFFSRAWHELASQVES